MHGKATLILTDKDTGRVVEQIEEHNMVTNALNSIFNIPPYITYDTGSKYLFNGFLPMYENVLKGLVLFSENIPENAYDFMLGSKYSVLATAGDEYSGTDVMRGSFNANSSGEIENGYRFVWDFAPEKAVGTIKCLSLTNRLLGNRGNLALDGGYSYYMINPCDLKNSTSSSNPYVYLLHGTGTFFLQKGKNTFYSYSNSSSIVKIMRYRIPNPLELKICDTVSGVLENEAQITIGFSTSAALFSCDSKSERLYAFYLDYTTINNVRYYKIRYAKINPVTAEEELETDWIVTSAPYNSNKAVAVFDGKIYLLSPNFTISVCSLSGELERTISLDINTFYAFVALDGKLAVDCKLTSSGRRCLHVLDGAKTEIMQHNNGYPPIATDEVNAPYCIAVSNSYVYLMFRTDYLATINNLSTPLEKTDQHALQVRYEITN